MATVPRDAGKSGGVRGEDRCSGIPGQVVWKAPSSLANNRTTDPMKPNFRE